MKLEFSRTIGGAAGMTPPSKAQQRLVNLVNAKARYGGHTDTVDLFGRATLMEVCDTVGLTSLDTMTTGNIFIFTESGEVYALQASGSERVQAGVAGFGQAAGSAAYGPYVFKQLTQLRLVSRGPTPNRRGRLLLAGR